MFQVVGSDGGLVEVDLMVSGGGAMNHEDQQGQEQKQERPWGVGQRVQGAVVGCYLHAQ